MDYNPAEPLDADDWLAHEEDERLDAIQRWLADLTGDEVDDCLLGAVPVLAIENQIAMNDPPVTRATLERLLSAGTDRMTAIQAMSEVMYDALADAMKGLQDDDPEAWARALDRIDPAEIGLDDPGDRPSTGSVPLFSDRHRQVLIEFGDRHAEEGAMSWPETAGFLFAVQACPDIVMPSEWTEIVQGQAVFADVEEAQAISEARIALLNWISDCIYRDRPAIPIDCTPDPQPMRILEADNNFSRWCSGFLEGHNWLEESWDEVMNDESEAGRSLGMTVVVFSFFIHRRMAEHVVAEVARESPSAARELEDFAEQFHALISQAVLEYAAIGLAYRQAPPEPTARQPVRSKKVGRNQPCPCGSGRKYKKCHGRPGANQVH
jgi:yecA family protein